MKEALRGMLTKPKKQGPRPSRAAEAQKRVIAKLKRWDDEERQLGEEIDSIEQEFKMLQGDRSQSRKKDKSPSVAIPGQSVEQGKEVRTRHGVKFEEALDEEFRMFKDQEEKHA